MAGLTPDGADCPPTAETAAGFTAGTLFHVLPDELESVAVNAVVEGPPGGLLTKGPGTDSDLLISASRPHWDLKIG